MVGEARPGRSLVSNIMLKHAGLRNRQYMTREQLEAFLTEIGYNKIGSNLPEYAVFFRVENQGINAINVIDLSAHRYMTTDQYEFIKQKVVELFSQMSDKDVHILSLIIGDHTDSMRDICVRDPFCWYIMPSCNRLILYENQTPDFYGLRGELERFLQLVTAGQYQTPETNQYRGNGGGNKDNHKSHSQIPVCVISLIAINAVLFIVCAFTGDLVYNIGGLSILDVVRDRAYYRIISSMFLHWDLNHLFSNMLILYYIGNVIEKQYGSMRFLILYFLAGIGGNLSSMLYEYLMGSYTFSAGASGAVFGLMGALLFLVLVHKGKFRQMTAGRVAFTIAFSLYAGITSEQINNAAHMGGLVSGFLLAGLLWITIRKDKRRYES